ncbi:hypothetical protein KAU09_04800 [Candidatus Parcubacteria bacterium]|nr:hypothetical protein [Candidatus Parcubacteria bacterium]
MALFIKTSRIICILIFMIFITGCAKLEWLDKKAGEIFFNASSIDKMIKDKESKDGTAPTDFKGLSKEHKDKIDKWLEENNLNRYGDAIGIFYAGGTPLFNEITGESKERFEYIMEKIPDILEKIK